MYESFLTHQSTSVLSDIKDVVVPNKPSFELLIIYKDVFLIMFLICKTSNKDLSYNRSKSKI